MRVDGDAVNVTDVFSYSLSDQAGALLATETAEVEYFPKALLQAFADELAEASLAIMHREGLKPFTCEEFADGWLRGLVCDAIHNGELTDKAAAELIAAAWRALPDYARQP